jgi:hypothetical protein
MYSNRSSPAIDHLDMDGSDRYFIRGSAGLSIIRAAILPAFPNMNLSSLLDFADDDGPVAVIWLWDIVAVPFLTHWHRIERSPFDFPFSAGPKSVFG